MFTPSCERHGHSAARYDPPHEPLCEEVLLLLVEVVLLLRLVIGFIIEDLDQGDDERTGSESAPQEVKE